MPIYLKFGKVNGSSNGNRKGWIELQSAQLGVHRRVGGSATGRVASRGTISPDVSEIVISKFEDCSSVGLVQSSLWGEGAPAIIEFTGDDGGLEVVYLRVEMENVLISSYSRTGDSGARGVRRHENFSLNFTKIEFIATATSAASQPAKRELSGVR